MVYDPDLALVTDILPCEDAHASERTGTAISVPSAQPGERWIADRHFCARDLLQRWQAASAGFIVREHAHRPRLWQERV